jgi:hypothetical protein
MFRRRANSRIAALAVLVVSIVVVGMVVVATGRLREAAKTMSCKNNLKQLGLAVANYDATFALLPSLTDPGEGPKHNLQSAFARLRPYVEACPFFYSASMDAERYNARSTTTWTFPSKIPGETITQQGGMANYAFRIFIDPGDRTATDLHDVEMQVPDTRKGYYAAGSYAMNGLVPWGSKSISTAFQRAAADTVLIAERPQVCQTASGDKVYNLWGLGFYSPHMPTFATLTPADMPSSFSTGQVAPVLPLPKEEEANRDVELQVRIGAQTAPPRAPDFATPVQQVFSNRPCDARLPGGPHGAGLLCGMADSSVRQFSWNTSPWVFWDACDPGRENENR